MSFVNSLRNELNNEKSVTENGAIGYKTTGKNLVDLNFAVASMRKWSKKEIIDKFIKAYYENPLLAIKWLFFARDVREGLGERRLFRVIMNYLAEQHENIALAVLELVPEYGRWDDLINLFGCNNNHISNAIVNILMEQLIKDMQNMRANQSISLLAKWMPSENTSSYKTKIKAKQLITAFETTPREYRKMLSTLREYLDITECKMSAKKWNKIDYSTVPSNANIKYSNAFLRNDETRRREYLENLVKGKTKINAGVLFPHDVVHKYSNEYWCGLRIKEYNEALEQMWKSIKCTGTIDNTIVVADGSGSMLSTVDNNSKVTALEVANSLAIYCGERCSGEFKDKYITFSIRPQLVDFGNVNSLHDKLEIARTHNEVSNTNIEAVFKLILHTAVHNNMTQDEIPKNILIISDMEFDMAIYGERFNATLFENIEKMYADKGYKLPKLIFWNVNSRTGTIPVKSNNFGVVLVSGFSVNVLNMVMNDELDPYKCLLKQLNSDRYKAIETVVSDCLDIDKATK